MKESSLIAYDDLERLVIKPGFCTLCGACEAACPIHAVNVERDQPHRILDCAEHLNSCQICYNVCPHTAALFSKTLEFVSDAPRYSQSIGHYRSILLAQATNPTIRDASNSGGVVSALLNFAISEKIIDSAVFSQASPKVPVKIAPSISLVPDDTLTAVDTKIVPSAVAEAFGQAVFEHGKRRIAFVGTPCHILALRKLEAWQHKLVGSLQITVGLFCLRTFSLDRLLEYLLQEKNIAANEIQNVDLGTEEYLVTTENGVVKIPLSDLKPCIMNRCRTCADFTSELADLSVGGAAPLENWSVVIARTAEGQDFLNRAITKGVISTKEKCNEPESVARLIQLASHKRTSALQEIKLMQKAKIPIPAPAEFFAGPVLSDVGKLENVKVKEIMAREVITVPADTTASKLLDEIADHQHTSFPVIGDSNHVIGIVTLQDVMRIPKKKRSSTLVSAVCEKSVRKVFPEDSVAKASEPLWTSDVRQLLVVDENKQAALLGIVTKSDVVNALRKIEEAKHQ